MKVILWVNKKVEDVKLLLDSAILINKMTPPTFLVVYISILLAKKQIKVANTNKQKLPSFDSIKLWVS